MIDAILSAAGFEKDVTYTETLFRNPPSKTFCVYFDDIETDGSDFNCEILNHNVSVELYALNKPDKEAEKRLEKALKKSGLHYSKLGRAWIQSEKYYQTVYDFNYTEKES